MALKEYTITTHSENPSTHVVSAHNTTYIFDADKITFIDIDHSYLNFDYLNRLTLNFDNYTQKMDWLNENILVPAPVCDCEQ